MEAIVTARTTAQRGAATRDALLDAAEGLIAEYGFRGPSHRMIAGAAKAHVALVNYHFSSKEMLFEAAIERRAARLGDVWRTALNEVRARPSPSVEDILEAWWLPFGARDLLDDTPWSNYLCIVARIATATDGEAWYQRYFGIVDRDFHRALDEALPGTHRDDVEAGFRYARNLMAEVLLYRCGKLGGACRPRGFREDDIGRLLSYLASGMRGLSGRIGLAAD
jgi:AcrR family transcriptional regulator